MSCVPGTALDISIFILLCIPSNYSKTWGKERNHHFHHLYLSNDSWESLCDAKACYCEDVKDLTVNVFPRNLPKLSQGPNRPDKAETKEDLGMNSRKIRPFGVMGWIYIDDYSFKIINWIMEFQPAFRTINVSISRASTGNSVKK